MIRHRFRRSSDSLFASSAFRRLVPQRRVVIIDGGARGAVVPPLDRIEPAHRTLVRFEPDSDAAILTGEGEHIVHRALWSSTGHVPLHITRAPSCSSVYPPDHRLLGGFIDLLGASARRVEQRVQVPATSIDAALREAEIPGADFIKLDVHSAEFEALAGAESSLANATIGVLVECWPLAIHAGQRSFAELHSLLEQAGFLPFDVQLGSWPRKPTVSMRYFSRPQTVQFEVLYLLDATGSNVSKYSEERLTILIGFAELFGQVTYALQIAHDAAQHGIIDGVASRDIARELIRRNRVGIPRFLLSRAARRLNRSLDRLVVPVAGQ